MTNPPIDPLREGEVMSLRMWLGMRGHVLNDVDDVSATRLVSIPSPVLNGPELEQVKSQVHTNTHMGSTHVRSRTHTHTPTPLTHTHQCTPTVCG